MYNHELATAILKRLDELFPDLISSSDLRQFQVKGFEAESEQKWHEAIDALIKRGWVTGKTIKDGQLLVSAANLVITPEGRSELATVRPLVQMQKSKISSWSNRADWEVVGNPLGSGGQSEVFLVRRLERMSARKKDIDQIHSYNPWGTSMAEVRLALTGKFADAVANYARDERISDLGAMKVFSKFREEGADGEQQAVERLRQEIEVLLAGRDGLPKLLDCNVNERWMVTEYFPARSLEYNFSKYKGNVALAFKAFLSLVKTVANLHTEGIIHRDIKPANVFVREDDQLVLGDFGIVFLPNRPNRPTRTGESVGPHDYMPPWAEVDGRLAEVHQSFDIYMLGKLLWCMVSGRLRLQREYFDRPENDLTKLFRDNPAMHMVNVILKRCVVESEAQCKTSASDLVLIVSTFLSMLERSGQLLHVGIPRPCRVCGSGHYQNSGYASTQPQIPKEGPVGLRLWIGNASATLPVYPFVCDTCGHVQFFTRPAPRADSSSSFD